MGCQLISKNNPHFIVFYNLSGASLLTIYNFEFIKYTWFIFYISSLKYRWIDGNISLNYPNFCLTGKEYFPHEISR